VSFINLAVTILFRVVYCKNSQFSAESAAVGVGVGAGRQLGVMRARVSRPHTSTSGTLRLGELISYLVPGRGEGGDD